MKCKLASFLLIILMVLLPNIAAARGKFALIIANKDYEFGGSLANPISDSVKLSESLTKAGFVVEVKTNLGYTAMRNAISEFGLEHSETDNVALLYYSGHGAEFNGKNYLIPVDAKLEDARKARQEALTLSDVQNFMHRDLSDAERESGKNARGLNIIVLDACRNNPYPARSKSASRGLGESEGASGTLIWYAAQPGAKASDGEGEGLSPFASAFVKSLDSSNGETVEETFKQIASKTLVATEGQQEPWQAGNILGRFSFKAGRGFQPLARSMLDKFNPHKFTQETVSLPIPPDYSAIYERYGDWAFGSVGKYIDGSYVVISGLIQRLKKGTAAYVAIKPKSGDINERLAIAWARNPMKKPDLWMKIGSDEYVFYRDIKKKIACVGTAERYDIRQDCYLGAMNMSQTRLRTAFSRGNRFLLKDGEDGEIIADISLKGSREAYANFQKFKDYVVAKENPIAALKLDYSKNLGQCFLNLEGIIVHKVEGWDDQQVGQLIKKSWPHIVKFHEAGDRYCNFVMGYILADSNIKKLVGDDYFNSENMNGREDEGVKLMVEGLSYNINTSRLEVISNFIDRLPLTQQTYGMLNQFKLVTQTNLLPEYKREPPFTDSIKTIFAMPDKFMKIATNRFAGEAFEFCTDIAKNKTRDALNCFREYVSIFSTVENVVADRKVKLAENKISSLAELEDCADAVVGWKYLAGSENIKTLSEFAASYSHCDEAKLALDLRTSLLQNN